MAIGKAGIAPLAVPVHGTLRIIVVIAGILRGAEIKFLQVFLFHPQIRIALCWVRKQASICKWDGGGRMCNRGNFVRTSTPAANGRMILRNAKAAMNGWARDDVGGMHIRPKRVRPPDAIGTGKERAR